MNWITLDRFPFPPSINGAYKSFMVNGKFRRAASPELREYKQAVMDYSLASSRLVQEIRSTFNLGQNPELELDIELLCPYERLYCKNGKPKRFDASNRVKTLEDSLFMILGADDSLVRRVSITKTVNSTEGDQSWARINIRPYTLNSV